MKIVIEVGDVSQGKVVEYLSEKNDNITTEVKKMYDFLDNLEDCTVINVDNFLLYALNNGLLNNTIKAKETPISKNIPKFSPTKYKIFELGEDGNKTCIQRKNGSINKNYFNSLMGRVMDDFYEILNYYEDN